MKIFSYCFECKQNAIWMENPEANWLQQQQWYEWEGSGESRVYCHTCKTTTKQRLKAIPTGTLSVE